MPGSGSGPAKHFTISGTANAALAGAAQPEGTPADCTHMITPHCLGAIDLAEYQPCFPMEYSGRWQFHLPDLRLRGILPAADTPPPRG
ncbi:hypothetical protein [Nisaea sp.]|uniref:hypothetical protein n=1 Tax=Nisaea sp. TaxID=2024842 RepID=UPI003B51F730